MPPRPSRPVPIASGILVLVLAVACGDGSTGPAGLEGRASIGPAGGTVALGEEARLDVPAGALQETTTIRIERVATPADLAAAGALGQAYRVEPVDLVLAVPARLAIRVPPDVLGERDIGDVTLLRAEGAAGALVPAAVALADIERTGNVVSGATSRLGSFAAAAGDNAPPTVSAGHDRTASVGQAVTLSATADDPDDDPLTFAWTFLERPAGSGATLADATTDAPSFLADAAGEYAIEVTVSDGRGGTARDTVRVTAVTTASVTADAGEDRTVTVGQAVTLDGRGSVGVGLTYAWRFVAAPGATPTLNGADAAVATFTAAETGTYEVELTVTDGPATDRDTVAVTAVEQGAPTARIAVPQAVFVGDAVIATAVADDPEGDPLTYTWSLQPPAGSVATLDPSEATARFTTDVPGPYFLSVTVSDGTNVTGVQSTVFGNPSVAGTYDTTFRTTFVSQGCGDSIRPGEETETMEVRQSSPSSVTLALSALSPNIRSDPTGILLGTAFTFSGPILVGNDSGQVNADGGISGMMDGTTLDLTFSFSVAIASCRVAGEIEGTRLP